MKFESKLEIGQKVWYYDNCAIQLTVGQIEIRLSKHRNGKEKYEERYMCLETGIGSGSIHELGSTIFLTEADCLEGNKEYIQRKKDRELRELAIEKEHHENRVAYHVNEVNRIKSKLEADK
jgi:hypothetical protein